MKLSTAHTVAICIVLCISPLAAAQDVTLTMKPKELQHGTRVHIEARFPGARAVTTPGIVDYINSHIEGDAQLFSSYFGDTVSRATARPSPLDRHSRPSFYPMIGSGPRFSAEFPQNVIFDSPVNFL